ncbi:MAG TPA: hypothetical protein VFW59_07930 [Gallionella sp.]|nr:hypothetical protein [Gallionella sp.]
MNSATARMKALGLALLLSLAMPGMVRAAVAPVVFQSTETPPFWSASLPDNGLGGELLSLLSEAAGLPHRLEYLPVARFRSSLAPYIVGDPDILISKEHRAIFPLCVFRAAFFFYKPHHEALEFRGIESLKGHTMGVLRGTVDDRDYFIRHGISIEESDSNESLLKKLHKGRLDFAILVDMTGIYTIKKLFPNEQDNFAQAAIPGSARPIAAMVDLSAPEGRAIAARYRQVINKTLRSQKHRDILERYLGAGKIPPDTFEILEKYIKFYETTWAE